MMTNSNDFWVPLELALRILGYPKDILEKRIAAGLVHKEIRGGIELLEISEEIGRFGLSEEVAREQLDKYINNRADEIVEKRKNDVDKFRQKPSQDSYKYSQNATPISNHGPSNPAQNSVRATDYNPQFNKLANMIEDLQKLSMGIPETVAIKFPKDSSIPPNQMLELKSEFNRLIQVFDKNQLLEKENTLLHTQLKAASLEITKLSTQANGVIDELERTNQKHTREIEVLKSTIKTEIGGINSILTLRAKSRKGLLGIYLFLILVCGGLSFLIFELMQPTYTVLAHSNDKINPLSKKDVTDVVKTELSLIEGSLKEQLIVSNATDKEEVKKNITESNTSLKSLIEAQNVQTKKSLDTLSASQKESKPIEENILKTIKTLESQIIEMEKQIKKLHESIAIKPGTNFIPDNKE